MCCRYRCQKAAAELRRALGNAADDAEKPTFCYLLEGIEGQRFCDPAEMQGHKLRNALQNADRTLCYLAYGDFGEYEGDKGTSDKRWVEYSTTSCWTTSTRPTWSASWRSTGRRRSTWRPRQRRSASARSERERSAERRRRALFRPSRVVSQ